jgi:hypothetical protein
MQNSILSFVYYYDLALASVSPMIGSERGGTRYYYYGMFAFTKDITYRRALKTGSTSVEANSLIADSRFAGYGFQGTKRP